MSRIKPIPNNPQEISQEQITPYLANIGKPISETNFNRNKGNDISMKDDTVKDVSIGLEDIDNAIMYYFNNVIKPNVIQNEQRLAVPVIYGSPERWKSIQADGFYRDAGGKTMVPLIMFKRENIEKNRTLGNKLDGNKVHNYQVIGSKYNVKNAYDRFSLLNNRIPSEQYYISAIPDYITVTYSCVIFTDFVEQNNKLVEAVQYASDSYWGDPNRWRFKSRIDSFTTTTLLENETDRAAKSTFTIILNGYIIPDTVNKDLASARSKFFTKSQVVFDMEIIDNAGQITNTEKLKFNNTSTQNTMGATSFIGGGNSVIVNNTIISSAASGDLTYLNTNKPLIASVVYEPDNVTFTGTILQPPNGSTLPATTVNNFTFYINGQYVPSSLVISFTQSPIVAVVFDTVGLGYTLVSTDEVVAIGKWQ